MSIYSIAVFDRENREVLHEVLRAESAHAALLSFSEFITRLKEAHDTELPDDFDELEELCDEYDFGVSIIEVK